MPFTPWTLGKEGIRFWRLLKEETPVDRDVYRLRRLKTYIFLRSSLRFRNPWLTTPSVLYVPSGDDKDVTCGLSSPWGLHELSNITVITLYRCLVSLHCSSNFSSEGVEFNHLLMFEEELMELTRLRLPKKHPG